MIRGWESSHKYPAFVLALLIGSGIRLGAFLPHSTTALLFWLAAILTVTLAFTLLFSCSGRAASVRSACAGFLCVCLGALQYRSDDYGSIFPEAAEHRGPVVLIGEIVDDTAAVGTRLRFPLRLRAVVVEGKEIPCGERGIATIIREAGDTGSTGLAYGSVVALRGAAEVPPEAGNPGELSPMQYYRANGITFVVRVRGWSGVRVLRSAGGSAFVRRIVIPLRRYILREIDREIGGEEGEFLKGLLIGERSGLSPPIRRAFLDSGVAHILAVSGSNVAVVAAAAMMFFSLLRLPRIMTRLVTVGTLVVYMFVTGSQPPVVRATIMAIVLMAGATLARRVHPLNGVGVAALCMFGLDARQLFDVGFQLSFGAVVAILVLYPRLASVAQSWNGNTRALRVFRQVWKLAAVSVAASFGTLPLTALAFGRLSIVGVAANLVIVPASEASVLLGMVSLIVAPLSAWGASACAAVNRILLTLTILSAEAASAVSWATLDTVRFRPVDALPYYAGLALLFCFGYPVQARRLLILFLAALNVSLFWPAAISEGGGGAGCTITMIDVGQGDAILVQTPGDHNVLVDTGPPSRDGSPWGTAVVPLLKRCGITRLDAVVVTHLHDDHAGGAVQVLRSCTVAAVVMTPENTRPDGGPVEARRQRFLSASAGTVFGDSTCRFYVLAPDSADDGQGADLNRRSLVLQFRYGECTVLFMGDAGEAEEVALVARYGGFLRSTILKVGHHGSGGGTTSEFLSTVAPEYALISVGRGNRFGHPSHATLRRLAASGADVLRTDEQGAVLFALDGRAAHQLNWR